MSTIREIEISKAFGAVVQLIEAIELSAMRDSNNTDGNNAIEILQNLIINQEDTPGGRGNANEACEKLHTLRAAVELLTTALWGV